LYISAESTYKSSSYHPGQRRILVSAPPTYGHRKCLDDLAYRSFPETPRHYQTMESVIGKRESLTQVTNEVKLPKLSVVQSASTHREDGIQDHGDEHDTKMSSRELDIDKKEIEIVSIEEIKPISESKTSFYQKTGRHNPMSLTPRPRSELSSLISRTGSRMKFDKLQYEPNGKSPTERRKSIAPRKAELPPFVQVEVLHPGQSFVSAL